MAQLKLEIVTPEAVSYSDTVDMVLIPGSEGELGILPQHIPLVTLLKPGELRVTKAGKETALAVGTGIVEISNDVVSVLTDMAVSEDQIDEAEAEAAIDRAKKKLEDKSLEAEEQAALEAIMMKSLAQLALKRRKRGM